MAAFASTKSLIIRAYLDSDLDKVAALFDDREINRTGPMPVLPMGVSARARSIPDMVSNCLMFVILEAKKDDNSTDDCDTWAGVMTLDGKKGIDKNREAHFGIAIRAPWQDKGFGTQATEWIVEYAFEQLGIHRVSLGMMASNERALALYKKCGFILEGRKRKAVWQDGEWQDMLTLAILEDEWRERRKTL